MRVMKILCVLCCRYGRMDRMALLQPMFVDITWGAGGSTQELTLEIAANAQKFLGVTVLMHLSCTGMSVEQLRQALEKAKEAGIKNILALRGDPPKGAARSGAERSQRKADAWDVCMMNEQAVRLGSPWKAG